MADGQPSTFFLLIFALLHFVAFGFALAAERRRSIGKVVAEPDATFCVYNSDIAARYGVGAFILLFLAQSLLMAVTKCLCGGSSLTPGSPRSKAIVYFISSWLTFLIAESCLLAGSVTDAYKTKYRNLLYAESFSCEKLTQGVFAAGGAFTILTLVLGAMYYLYYCKSRHSVPKQFHEQPPNAGKSNIAISSYC